MIKKQLLVFNLVLLTTIPNAHAFITTKKAHTVLLESPILRFVDGHSFGIDGKKGIPDLMRIIREIGNLHYGRVLKNRKRVGQFMWQGEKHSLSSLAALEREYIKLGTYNQHRSGLNKLLQEIKNTFEKIVEPFMKQARGAKGQMLILIEESCTKRNLRKDTTFLLRWGAAKEGEDIEMFKRDMDRLSKLDVFCFDLVNFLEDLMHSCRKAMGQFIHSAKTKMVSKHVNNVLKNKSNKETILKNFLAYLNKNNMKNLTWKQANDEQYIKKLLNEFKPN